MQRSLLHEAVLRLFTESCSWQHFTPVCLWSTSNNWAFLFRGGQFSEVIESVILKSASLLLLLELIGDELLLPNSLYLLSFSCGWDLSPQETEFFLQPLNRNGRLAISRSHVQSLNTLPRGIFNICALFLYAWVRALNSSTFLLQQEMAMKHTMPKCCTLNATFWDSTHKRSWAREPFCAAKSRRFNRA